MQLTSKKIWYQFSLKSLHLHLFVCKVIIWSDNQSAYSTSLVYCNLRKQSAYSTSLVYCNLMPLWPCPLNWTKVTYPQTFFFLYPSLLELDSLHQRWPVNIFLRRTTKSADTGLAWEQTSSSLLQHTEESILLSSPSLSPESYGNECLKPNLWSTFTRRHIEPSAWLRTPSEHLSVAWRAPPKFCNYPSRWRRPHGDRRAVIGPLTT